MPRIAPLVAGDPAQLGSFRLTGRIGEGGQGVVYLGMSAAGEQVAVKLLHVKFTGDATARARFARELRAAQRVASFCTARVVAADLEGDTPYIASEYIDGRSLREVVDEDGPLRGSALDRLAIGMATALTAIHHASIVHRDLKPDNVLMAADGPRVVDFGIARIIDSTGTITSRAIGTPAYMAPEQISGDDIGPYTDVFAWGATIAFAASGEMPFGGKSLAIVLNRILNHEVDLGGLQEPLRGAVLAALAKDPSARPSADQVLLRMLGHPESAGPAASSALLSQGVQVANPASDEGEVTRQARMPTIRRDGGPPRSDRGTDAIDMPAGHVASSRTPPDHAPSGHLPSGHMSQGPPGHLSSGGPSASGRMDVPPPSWQSDVSVPSWQGTAPSWQGTAYGPDPSGSTLVAPRNPRARRTWLIAALVVVLVVVTAVTVILTTDVVPGLGGSGGTATATPGTGQTSGEPSGPTSGQTFASVLDKVESTGELNVGVRNFLPGVALLSNGTWSGFEVDLAKRIAGRLGVRPTDITFRQTIREERPALLAAGDVDFVISTYSVNDQDAVTFAGPYYLAHVDVLVSAVGTINTLADLAGRPICRPAGSGSVAVVQREVKVELVNADNYAECMNLLKTGQVVAVPGDDLLLAGFADRESTRYKVLGAKLTDERYAIALRQGDVRACEAIQSAIVDLYAEGVVRRLLDQHFANVDFTAEDRTPTPVNCR